jgi:hypothetical protein
MSRHPLKSTHATSQTLKGEAPKEAYLIPASFGNSAVISKAPFFN